MLATPPTGDFGKSLRTELKGRFENGTFFETPLSQVSNHMRVFGSRFVNEIKRMEQGKSSKSTLSVQNYSDGGTILL